MRMLYPVNEIFLSLQGEGAWSGTPMVFIRFQGCPVQCGWCDTPQAWICDAHQKIGWEEILNKEGGEATWAEVSATALVAEAESLGGASVRNCCFTGGEPALHDLRPLAALFEAKGWRLFCETSGTEPLHCSESTWVALSPKIHMRSGNPVRPEVLSRADELKLPIARPADLTRLERLLDPALLKPGVRISLQPVSQSPTMTRWCIQKALERGWSLSIQLHRWLNLR